jgi:hypothetical protein
MLGAGKLRAWDASAVQDHHASKLGAQPNGMPKLRSLETGPAYRFANWAIESVPKVAAGVAAGLGPRQCFDSRERRRV